MEGGPVPGLRGSTRSPTGARQDRTHHQTTLLPLRLSTQIQTYDV